MKVMNGEEVISVIKFIEKLLNKDKINIINGGKKLPTLTLEAF